MNPVSRGDLVEAARIVGQSIERAAETYADMQRERTEMWREVATSFVSELQAMLWKR